MRRAIGRDWNTSSSSSSGGVSGRARFSVLGRLGDISGKLDEPPIGNGLTRRGCAGLKGDELERGGERGDDDMNGLG